jgi:predicted ATPase
VIRKVVLRNFKRFDEVTFEIPGHIVLAGPNNTGKTTLLQALSAFHFAFKRWKETGSIRKNNGAYRRKEIGRGDFTAVPVRALDLIWTNRRRHDDIQIEVTHRDGWVVNLEFVWDTPEQMFVRPTGATAEDAVAQGGLNPVFIPATSGISRDEPFYVRDEYLDLVIGQAKPGEILRNILVRASNSGEAWQKLVAIVQDLFGYELAVPQVGALITAEFRAQRGGPAFDIASAGSGFQQVLTLFGYLFARPGSLLLIDEPDAHLHVILQELIWSRLRRIAAETRSQLIVATHAETFIDAVDPDELCLCYQRPRLLRDMAERDRLTASLRALSNTDLMLAQTARGVLYTEDWTDREILRAWARVLNHPVAPYLEQGILWKPKVIQLRDGGEGIGARAHYEALQLARENLPALELVDGDAHPGIQSSPVTGQGFQRQRWRRYEIESYLFHPRSLARYVAQLLGAPEGSEIVAPHIHDMITWIQDNLPPAVVREPLGDHEFLNNTKARTNLIPPILAAAGFPGMSHTRFSEIAAIMRPDEIHPEIREKLDAIQRAFGL